MESRGLRNAISVFASIACSLMSMGCLALNFGGWSQKTEDPSVLTQTGSTPIPKGQEATVYARRSEA